MADKHYETYTFKDTGEVVTLRKVSPLLLIKLRERYPQPKPPLQKVEYGPGEVVMEPNPAHPDYIETLAKYEQDMERRARDLLIRRGVVIEWTDDKRKALADLREWWAEAYGEPMPAEDDTVAYISYLAIGSDSDLSELFDALVKRSHPTEEAISQAQDRLKSQVP